MSLSDVAWSSEADISFEGSTGISPDVARPVITAGGTVVNASGSFVILAGTDKDGSTGGRLSVGEITAGGASSVTLAALEIAGIGIGRAFEGRPSPTVSEMLAEYCCVAREGSMGGWESVTEGVTTGRPPRRSDVEAGFSETGSVPALREGSITGSKSVIDAPSVAVPVSAAREGSG